MGKTDLNLNIHFRYEINLTQTHYIFKVKL